MECLTARARVRGAATRDSLARARARGKARGGPKPRLASRMPRGGGEAAGGSGGQVGTREMDWIGAVKRGPRAVLVQVISLQACRHLRSSGAGKRGPAALGAPDAESRPPRRAGATRLAAAPQRLRGRENGPGPGRTEGRVCDPDEVKGRGDEPLEPARRR